MSDTGIVRVAGLYILSYLRGVCTAVSTRDLVVVGWTRSPIGALKITALVSVVYGQLWLDLRSAPSLVWDIGVILCRVQDFS